MSKDSLPLGLTYASPHIHLHSRVIALSRLTLGAMLLLIAATDISDPGIQSEPDDWAAMIYFGSAICLAGLAWIDCWRDFAFSKIALLLDIALLVFTILFVDPSARSHLAIVLCLQCHVLLCSALLMGWKMARFIALCIFVTWICDVYLEFRDFGAIDIGLTLRRTGFLITASMIALWAALQNSETAVPRLALPEELDGTGGVEAALEYARNLTHARGALLCLRRPVEDGPSNRRAWGNDLTAGATLVPDKLLPKADLPFCLLFDVRKGKALKYNDIGIRRDRELIQEISPILSLLNIDKGIGVKIDIVDQSGLLLLFDIRPLTWSHLLLARAVGAEVSRALSSRFLGQMRRRYDLIKVREELAHDLHDSVAQSLAGAKFLISALRSQVSPSDGLSGELERVRNAFDFEHQHVRMLIARLRQADWGSADTDLVPLLDMVLRQLSRHWKLEASIVDVTTDLRVGHELAFEIEHIVREAVANAARHGSARRVEVTCSGNGAGLRLVVTDNGTGFDITSGLIPRTIARRVGKLDGKLDIESKVGLTRLTMDFPCGVSH